MKRIAFMGTPEFAEASLRALCAAEFKPVVVYTQPPRPAGRGMKDQKSPVHVYAESQNIPVLCPKTLKTPDTQTEFKNFNLDLAIVAAYGLLLPQEILDAPELGCVNIHASLLPRWRGAAPIQRAILAGDRETGIALMQMDRGLDTGAVFIQKSIQIGEDMNAGELHDQLAQLGANMIVQFLPDILSGKLRATPQPASGETYAKKVAKDEARIDWHKSAMEIKRQIQAFNPYPGAYFEYQGERIKILSARIDSCGKAPPGTIIDDQMQIATSDGILIPLTLQRAGKQPITKADFLRGFSIPKNTILP